jgi:hypothetical protein
VSVTVETFLENYAEFAPLHEEDAAYVAAVLARAERRIGPSWPEETRDDIVMLQAAHNLATSPMGRNARLSDKDGTSSYGCELHERKKGNAFARCKVV